MEDRLERAFAGVLAENLGTEGRREYYGIRIDEISPSRSEFDLILVFKAGERYCCPEPGCHLGYDQADWWLTLRGLMEEQGIGDLPPLTIRKIRGIVERGTRLQCRAVFERPEESDGFSYEHGPIAEIVDREP
jgi:hypothetical protein